jgi:hypothetical protein
MRQLTFGVSRHNLTVTLQLHAENARGLRSAAS